MGGMKVKEIQGSISLEIRDYSMSFYYINCPLPFNVKRTIPFAFRNITKRVPGNYDQVSPPGKYLHR